MPLRLTSAQQANYFQEGWVAPVPVLTADEVHRYRAACNELEARLGGRPRTIEVRQMHLHFRWAYELATHPRVLDVVEDLLGPNLLIWATELFVKHPHDGAISIGWHRDRPYMGFDSRSTTTGWIALSESNPANGCLRVIPGTAGRTVEPGTPDEEQAADVPLAPGEMSLHDSEILHGSLPNRSAVKRVGFVIRYVTPAARPRFGRPQMTLARGQCAGDCFEPVLPPQESSAEDALASMKRSADLHLEAMLRNLEAESGHAG